MGEVTEAVPLAAAVVEPLLPGASVSRPTMSGRLIADVDRSLAGSRAVVGPS